MALQCVRERGALCVDESRGDKAEVVLARSALVVVDMTAEMYVRNLISWMKYVCARLNQQQSCCCRHMPLRCHLMRTLCHAE